jgi:hypothetical protein
MHTLPDARREDAQRNSFAALAVWGLFVIVTMWMILRWSWFVDLLLDIQGCYTVATVIMLAWINRGALWLWLRERRQAGRPGAGPTMGFTPTTATRLSPGERAVYLDEPRREDPSLILGATRTAKSTLASQLARQDLARGAPLAVIDPHRDLALSLLESAARADRP